ncbi:MAG: ATP-grasp domain-containing protein [Alphaproteobacteria bacterium]|nr:ATP-grasp domain-containing protein [Alphaproteobacteria bacterium]
MRHLRVLALAHPDLIPPDSLEGVSEQQSYAWKTEYDVITTLRASGHEVKALGVQEELTTIRDEIENWKPDIVFNLLEECHGQTLYAQNVVSLLELLHMPYTGCSPRGIMLARGKDLSKKLLKYHRIPVPAFGVFPLGRKVKRPKGLEFPLIVKSLSEDASLGISQASVVETDEKLVERVGYIHERVKTAAIAEQYIEGREIYVGVLGNDRRQILPLWELEFSNLSGTRLIATEMAKHNLDYQSRRGVIHGPARNLPPALITRIRRMVSTICQTLELDGYARIDFRLSEDLTPYFIEANPNPEIASSQEFAYAAAAEGLTYPDLLNRILALGMERAGQAVG